VRRTIQQGSTRADESRTNARTCGVKIGEFSVVLSVDDDRGEDEDLLTGRLAVHVVEVFRIHDSDS
jgi:hypothetical protein